MAVQQTSGSSTVTWSTFLLHRWPAVIGTVLASITPFAQFSPNVLLPFALGLIICAVSYPLFGTFLRQWQKLTRLTLQLSVFIGFVVVAALALQFDAAVSKYILAAAFLLHTLWDIYYFKVQQVVPRWYAEACGVYDVILAIIIIFLPI